MSSIPNFPTLLERFFTERLMRQRGASPHTIACYRDAFRLLLRFAEAKLHTRPSDLELSDISANVIDEFLDHLEKQRSVSIRTRNLRLSAIRSFFSFAAFEEPAYSANIQRILTIPAKRRSRPLIEFLTRPEIDALLAVPDRRTWIGRRDHALLLLAVQTGLRLSETTSLDRDSLSLSTGAYVRCEGKGRVCCIQHTRPNVFHVYMFSCPRTAQKLAGFEERVRNINFCSRRTQIALRKPIKLGSVRQRFAAETSSPRSVRASAFAFISRSTSA